MRRLFIYYRVASAQAAAALPQVRALQEEACALHPGLQAELLRRPEEKDGVQTWMEVYCHPDGVSPVIENWLADASLRPAVSGFDGNLYVELFVPCVL